MKFLGSPIIRGEGRPSVDDIFLHSGPRSQYLLDLLVQVPDPRKKRAAPPTGRRDRGGGRGVEVVRRGRAVGRRRAARGPAEESTFRRAFALVSADRLDQVLASWLHTRAARADGRLVIAVDGKTVRGAKDKDGKAPHLVATLAHGIGTILGQVAVTAKPNEIPAVRELLKGFASLARAVLTRAAITSSRSWNKVGQGFTRGIGGRQERPNLSDLRGDETRLGSLRRSPGRSCSNHAAEVVVPVSSLSTQCSADVTAAAGAVGSTLVEGT